MARRITEDEVRHVARLSRLHLSDDEIQMFAERLGAVLDYVARLNELDVDGVEPLSAAVDMTNVLRADTEQTGLPVDAALTNAPDQSPPFFKVPKVLDDASGA